MALEIIKNKFGEYEYNKMLNGQTNMVKIDIVYFPDINEYNGRKSVQLLIQNIGYSSYKIQIINKGILYNKIPLFIN